jgi:6-pyruvoyltetrahydropterin/6-carboxytetrahydropterin synthase
MITIRKEFKYEMGHIVRNAYSERCAFTPHGHSYRVEFLLKGDAPDAGQMVMDFGYIKQFLGPYVDSFDHSFWLWDRKEDAHVVKFFSENFQRIITSPFSTSAEVQAKLFFVYGEAVLHYLRSHGGLYAFHRAHMESVRVHETTTGYAEYTGGDDRFPQINLADVKFASGITKDWTPHFTAFYESLLQQTTK